MFSTFKTQSFSLCECSSESFSPGLALVLVPVCGPLFGASRTCPEQSRSLALTLSTAAQRLVPPLRLKGSARSKTTQRRSNVSSTQRTNRSLTRLSSLTGQKRHVPSGLSQVSTAFYSHINVTVQIPHCIFHSLFQKTSIIQIWLAFICGLVELPDRLQALVSGI